MTEEDLKDHAEALKYLIDRGTIKQEARPYLGMSQLGDSCARKLWFYLHWAAVIEFKPRILRIFAAGDDTETIVINELRRLGVQFESVQQSYEHANGIIKGHSDGIISHIPEFLSEFNMLLEVKSMKAAKWKSFVKNGIKYANKGYWCQCQVYMNKSTLDYCLFAALNKDTSEIHFEIIKYDLEAAAALLQRGEDIVNAKVPPKGVSTDPTWYECSWCDFNGVCHKNENFQINCRTCTNCEIQEGAWLCTFKNIVLSEENQRKACKDYNMLKV